MTSRRALRAPFPWFGGKSLAAPMIWRAFGNVPNYVEPFAGSLATLLARPHAPKVETVNDKDGLISNFWRAVQHAPDDVARWADWPVNEADLHARHRWLVDAALPLTERLIADPDWFDAKVAGWWVWGICSWIGNGWCSTGVASRQIPALSRQGQGIHSRERAGAIEALGVRMRRVRVCCGDWSRVVGPSTLGLVDSNGGGMRPCGVLLDPPYAHFDRDNRLYREDDAALSGAVRAWAVDHGDDPNLRIALCGWEGEHDMPATWTCIAWRGDKEARGRAKERIWFSPHCLQAARQRDLFAPLEASA